MPAPSTWTFRTLSALTFVGILTCFAMAAWMPRLPSRPHPLSALKSRILIDDGARFESGVKSPKSIRVALVRLDGTPAQGEHPSLTATGDQAAAFDCDAADERGESRCSITPSIDGSLILKLNDSPLLHRAVIRVFHSSSKLESVPAEAEGGSSVLRWRVHLSKPWRHSAPLVWMEGAERFAASCDVMENRTVLECGLTAETPGPKKIRLLRPLLAEVFEGDLPAPPKMPPALESSAAYIGRTSQDSQRQIVALRLLKNGKPVEGVSPKLAVLARAPVGVACTPTDKEGNAECRLSSMVSQKVEAWSSGDYPSKRVALGFELPTQSFNPDFVFGDPGIVTIRFQSSGQYERTIPRLIFQMGQVTSECLPETGGFFECAMMSSQPGVLAGSYRLVRSDDEAVSRETGQHRFEVTFPRLSGP